MFIHYVILYTVYILKLICYCGKLTVLYCGMYLVVNLIAVKKYREML